jgi:hypothetical protein
MFPANFVDRTKSLQKRSAQKKPAGGRGDGGGSCRRGGGKSSFPLFGLILSYYISSRFGNQVLSARKILIFYQIRAASANPPFCQQG